MRPLLILAAAAGLIGSLLPGLPAQAQSPDRPPIDFLSHPRITAQIILDSLLVPPGAKHETDRTGQQWFESDQAQGYLRAVLDSPPITWCIPVGYKTSEVLGDLLAHLAALTPTVRQRDAAPVIREALLARYPCNKRKEG